MDGADHALVHTLLRLPPADTLGLPAIGIRWLLALADDAAAAPYLMHSAVAAFGEAAGGRGKQPLVVACATSPDAASLLVRLLTSHLHEAHARPGGVRALLRLVHACVSHGDGGIYATAGLLHALHQLCKLLRSSDDAEAEDEIQKMVGITRDSRPAQQHAALFARALRSVVRGTSTLDEAVDAAARSIRYDVRGTVARDGRSSPARDPVHA
jgi:hypothetical protein